jgi:Cu(I)/Ag(I) efflux system membrane fusion protein
MDYMPEREWSGKVDYIYPTLNQQNRTLRVRLKFANPKHELKPNMFSRVTIHSDLNKASLMVPKEAVIRTGKQDRVVVALGNGKYKSIEVSIGHVGEQYIELLSGVKEGETVVSSAQFLLDSESSKTSDFGRMHHDKKTNSVWMSGTIESVMVEHNMLTISHDEVPEWEWPRMTMDFLVSEDVDMRELAKGQTIHFEVLKKGSDYRVNVVHVRAQPSYSSATVMGIINQIQPNSRMLNISRGPIEKWGREAATMDFVASENIDLSTLSEGQHIKFTFEVREELVVVKIHESHENSPMQENQSHKGHE